jgi:CheY-like chemotaxis protein
MQLHEIDILLEADADQTGHFQAVLAAGKIEARVRVATCDADALALLHGPELPDLIFLDSGLPGADAVGVMRAIRADPNLVSVPVVVLGDRADERLPAADDADRGPLRRLRRTLEPADLFDLVRSVASLGLCIITHAEEAR